MKSIIWGSASAVALMSTPVAAQPMRSLAEDAAAFGARESIIHADLSPDGSKVVYIAPVGGDGETAVVADLKGGAPAKIARMNGGAENLRWCNFVTDTRLICNVTAIADRVGALLGFTRLFAIDTDGSNIKALGQRESFYDSRIRQFDAEVIDWLPGGSGEVLMAREKIPEEGRTGSHLAKSDNGLSVDRVDTRTLKSTNVEPPNVEAAGYMSDGHGNVRLKSVLEVNNNGYLTGRRQIRYRLANSREWKVLSDFVDAEEFEPLAIDAEVNSLYALQKLNGRYALYRIRLDEQKQAQLVASNARVDIDDVVRSANGQRVIGYTFVDDKRQTEYFDPAQVKLQASLAKALPKLPLIQFAGASADGSKRLLFAGSDADPGRYYLFDSRAKRLEELLLVRPALEKYALASVKSVSVRAADGTQIPAYLTLPVGKEAKNLPSVVLPHGGPSSRDEWGFDWLAQFLAARGYAVLQPNYRGSSGFGDAWLMDNGFKSWRTSIGDITASARWLASEGIADSGRIAVVGWSYGGYAALQSAATDPDLFKAVVAIAPVTDLSLLKQEYDRYTNAKVVRDFIGSGPHIVEGSPLKRASAIKVPVLLAHGDLDANVGVGESDRMARVLKDQATPVEFLRYAGLDHQLDDSRARTELLTKMGALLERTIGH